MKKTPTLLRMAAQWLLADASFWIGRGYRDAGLGTEALPLALDYAFSELDLHKVFLRVLDFNARAIHVYEKCGFRQEGLLREEMYSEDAWHHLIYMGILRHEYEALRRNRSGDVQHRETGQ